MVARASSYGRADFGLARLGGTALLARIFVRQVGARMSGLSLSAATIAALRARHVAFLNERLVDERAHGDFVRSFAAGYDHLLAQPLCVVIDAQRVVDVLDHVLDGATLRGLLSPIVRELKDERRLNPNLTVELRVDEEVSSKYPIELMDRLWQGGFVEMGLPTLAPNQK